MKIVFFVHSLISDWNNGNAHFLRGIVSELKRRNHSVIVYEPVDSWSAGNLVECEGYNEIVNFHLYYPLLCSFKYNIINFDLDRALDNADLVIVHEWNTPEIVSRIGLHKKTYKKYVLLFHDTHHRTITAPEVMAGYDLRNYDGVLAFGEKIRLIYLKNGWVQRAWTWHEAADTSVFKPVKYTGLKEDLVWIGNWGDEERSRELCEFFFEPVKKLKLKCSAYGVRFPQSAIDLLSRCGINYHGWLPNYRVPEIFSKFKLTVHIPRQPYVNMLSGIPTIRPFEALACGIPLVCSPWNDCDGLFRAGKDYLVANNGTEMEKHIKMLLNDSAFADEIVLNGLQTVISRHTCAHRVNELLEIVCSIKPS
ncbi:MAG: glycosyltransferase [Fibrobacter sp.]|nr:glycosyltransferase [Fibrobacter sp.]